MSNLHDLQRQFQEYILQGSPKIYPQIVATPQLSVETRLGIYSHAYVARLLEVLELDFPGLNTLLGDDSFQAMAHAYLQSYPSLYRSVRWFAAHLVDFLTRTEPYRDYPSLAEMAAFEWEIQNVLDAADDVKVTVAEVAALPAEKWPEIRLRFHSSVRRLDCRWNVVGVWQAVEEGADIPELAASEWPVPWVLWRSADLQVFFASMPVAEAWALDTMRAGSTFAEMCAGLNEWMDEEHAGEYAAGLLKGWLEQGMISQISHSTGPDII